MAQSKSFFGLRRGSTKTLTFSVYNGKQVTKDRVADVKNPRSSAQMKQRAIMATALRGYSALKEICDHSFEGITYGQKSMNYFVAENARMLRAAAPSVNLSFSKGNSVSNNYIIAKGSLPTIEVDSVSIESDNYQFQIPMSNGKSGITFGKVMANLGASLDGDMVTFVFLKDNPGGNASIYWIRLKLSNVNKAVALEEGDNVLEKLTEGTDFETNIDNFTPNDISLLTMENHLVAEIPNEQGDQSLGVIMSRKTDSGWLRSSSIMASLKDAWNYDEALASYPESGEKILNGGNM